MKFRWSSIALSMGMLVSFLSACEGSAPMIAGSGGLSAAGGATSAGGATVSGGSSNVATGGTFEEADAGPPVAAAITISGATPKTSSPLFQGVNYWSWVVSYGAQVVGTEQLVKVLKPTLLRVGGANADNSTPEAFSNAVMEASITYARAIGAEPLIQVPVLRDASGNVPTAQTAADIVQYLNVTQSLGVKYFSIGNEPDIYVDGGQLTAYTADQACQTFSAFADAMKQVDPSIKIVGPDFSWKYQVGSANDWLTPFLANCKSKLDVLAVHRYPIDPTQTTEARAALDAAAFRATLRNLRSAMDAQGMTSTPLAITEYNITWDGDPAKSTLPASPGTFPAAMWAADVHGVGLEEQLWSLDYWSISEGWTLSMLNGKTPRPSYFALEIYADHFGPTVLTTTGTPAGMSVYSSRNATNDGTQVVAVNWNPQHYDLTVSFENLSATIPNTTIRVSAQSISAFDISDTGQAKRWVYTEDVAATGGPPVSAP